MVFEATEKYISKDSTMTGSSAASRSVDSWSDINLLSRPSASLPAEFGTFELLSQNDDHPQQRLAQFPWQQRFSNEQDAALFELSRINQKSDHAKAGVEYNAMVGHSKFGVQHSHVHKSAVDDGTSSNNANHAAIFDLGGGFPDIMIHSHPLQEGVTSNGEHKLRPWWLFSQPDIEAQKITGQSFGTKMQGYILGPGGEVLTWKEGDQTMKTPEGLWGVPTIVGKFDKEGNYLPLKKPVSFDHKNPPGALDYDNDHKISRETFGQWEKGNYSNRSSAA